MQQPLIPRADRSRGEYSIQPTEDHEDFNDDIAGGKKPPVVRRPGKAPNYKPKPLRWPFITGLVVMLCVAIVLVAYAERALPDSDSDAIIVDSIHDLPNHRRLFVRQNITAAEVDVSPSTSQVVVPSVTAIPSEGPIQVESATGGPGSSVLASAKAVSTPIISPTAVSISVEVSETSAENPDPTPASGASQTPNPSDQGSRTVIEPSAVSESTSVIIDGQNNRGPGPSGGSGAGNASVVSGLTVNTASLPTNVVPIGTSVLTRTLGSTTLEESTITTVINVTTVTTYTSYETISLSDAPMVTSVFVTTLPVPFYPPSSESGSFFPPRPSESWAEMTLTTTFPVLGSGIVSENPVVVTETQTKQSSIVSTIPATVAPIVGEVTVTYFSTLSPNGGDFTAIINNDPNQKPGTADNGAQPIAKTTVIDVPGGVTVETQAPVVLTIPTATVGTFTEDPQLKIVTTQVGGGPVTSFLVLTPIPATPTILADVATTVGGKLVTITTQPPLQTFESVINGVLQTVVETPPAETIVSLEGGTLTTVGAILTAAGPGQPITFTVVADVGGTPVTQVVVSTPAGGVSFLPITFPVTTSVGGTPTVITITPEPTSFVTTIDGTPVTMFTTPPVTSFTTTAGGSEIVTSSVITPTGTGLITITFVSTSGGTLTTFTSTISPGSTFLSTISGTLTTITSTPSPKTRTLPSSKITKTSTFTPTGTTSMPTPTVANSTRVFKWTESDIFVGTFLPSLFGVGLVIPLRIIDLNAKLYQPFQSLAQPGGGSGAETLTMQYTGFMTFITPITTLLQGHPVPFLTTLMVLCGSFIVPLATEAIGLKLHGRCIRNTAIDGCGPSLGVSPAPAHALIGLIVAVILLLLIVLFLISRWATGVHANPWNIAGIASLAGNSSVRIRQNSEKAMKRAVSQKQYGLGYFMSATSGREQYGIVLTDESGRGLQDLQPTESNDSDGLIDTVGVSATGKRTNSANNLPLMPLRYPWRLALIAFEVGLLIFIIYYHVYYHVTLNDAGRVFDDGRLWEFMNANTFGVRFVAAIVGVVIAFCWQSFFLSVSIMAPYQAMALATQPPERSILLSPCTNAFSGLYSSIKQRHLFLFATSLAAILSELLPVFLANVFFSLSQTNKTATACASIASIILGLSIMVLVSSFFVKWPPMPVDPRSIGGMMYYVSLSHMLEGGDFEGVSELNGVDRERKVKEKGRRYFYGVLVGGSWRRLGVDCDLGTGPSVTTGTGTGMGMTGVDTAYHGIGGVAGGLMSGAGGLAEGGRPGTDNSGIGTAVSGGEGGGGGGGNGSGSGSGGFLSQHGRSISRDSRSAGGASAGTGSGISRIDEPPALHEHDEGLLAASGGMRGGGLGTGGGGGSGFLGPSFSERVAGALGRSPSTASAYGTGTGTGTGLLGFGYGGGAGGSRGGYDTIPPPPPGMFSDRG